jgi:hypothetical protein
VLSRVRDESSINSIGTILCSNGIDSKAFGCAARVAAETVAPLTKPQAKLAGTIFLGYTSKVPELPPLNIDTAGGVHSKSQMILAQHWLRKPECEKADFPCVCRQAAL